MTMRNRRGSVLMLVIIFSLIMSLLGFAVIYLNGLEYMAVRRDLMDEKATLAAEAGLELGREFLYYCDACLERKDDLEITFGVGNATSTYIANAMKKCIVHWDSERDNILLFGGPVILDTFPPAASCEVWISSANYNTHITSGVYEYRITSRGRSTFGFAGTLDTVVDESVLVQISSMTDADEDSSTPFVDAWPECAWAECGGKGLRHLPDALPMPLASKGYTRYYFKYKRDSGKSRINKPPVRVYH